MLPVIKSTSDVALKYVTAPFIVAYLVLITAVLLHHMAF